MANSLGASGNCTGGSVSLADFKQLSLLGEGAYSAVYKVTRLADREIYALKKVKLPSLSEKEKNNALNEIRLLASISHENVVAYKEAFFDDKTRCLCIVQECADAGDLLQAINRCKQERTYIREQDSWRYFSGMCHGLQALHDLRVLHRDLKSANIFLSHASDGTIAKLGDFNVSKVAKRGLCMTQTGTPYYASPEVWRDMPYDAKSDMWSLGCVLYEMLALRPPFRAEDMEGLYRKVVQGKYPRIPNHYSADMAEVVAALLQVHARHRPAIDQLLTMPAMLRNATGLKADPSRVQTGASDLLNTIKLPKNAMDLAGCLPKARYGKGLPTMESIPSEREQEDSPKPGPKGGRRPRDNGAVRSRLNTPGSQVASAAELGSYTQSQAGGARRNSPPPPAPARPKMETPQVQSRAQLQPPRPALPQPQGTHEVQPHPPQQQSQLPQQQQQHQPAQQQGQGGDALDCLLSNPVQQSPQRMEPAAARPPMQPSGPHMSGGGGASNLGLPPVQVSRAASVAASERSGVGYGHGQGPTINPRYSSAQQLPYTQAAPPAVINSASGIGRPPRTLEPRRPMAMYARAQYTPSAAEQSSAAPSNTEVHNKAPPSGGGSSLRRPRSLIPRLF